MKQTNNAIKFLMAQYRAIFKNAYFKGLTSAVLLTAGMAVAGNAQAADIGTGADSWAEVTTSNDITLSEEKTFSGGIATGSNRYYNNITINNGGTLKNSGAATISVKGDITVNSGGNLTLSGTTSHIAGFNLGATNDGSDDVPSTAVGTLYNKNGGIITIGGSDSNSLMQMQNVVFESGSTTTINGSGASTKANSTIADAAYIFAGISGQADRNGRFDINKGATVNVKDFGYIAIEANGTMNVNGTVNITASDSDSFAGIRAADAASAWDPETNPVVTLNQDAVINVESGDGRAMIIAPQVNINGATINVKDGASFYLSGDVENNGTTSGSALVESTAGQFNMTSGKINVAAGGTLIISNGQYDADSATTTDLDETKLINTLTIQGGELAGAGTVQVNGKLVASANTINTFLTGKDSDGNQNAGQFKFSGGETIFEVTGSEQFDLAKYSFSGSGTTDFVVADSGSIVGENLAVSHKLTQDGTATGTNFDQATKLTIEATNLTLGSNTYNDTASLNFSGATARNLTLLGSGNAFTLADDITLEAIDNVDNPFLTAEGTLKVAGEGQLNTEDTTTLSGGTLTIAAGHYSSNDNITLDSGSLTIGGQTAQADGVGVDASLTLTGTLTLDNTNDANTITITGNGNLPITKDNNGSTSRTAVSTLDLTNVRDIEVKGHASNLTTFKVNGDGELLLSSNAFNKILDVANTNTQYQYSERRKHRDLW